MLVVRRRALCLVLAGIVAGLGWADASAATPAGPLGAQPQTAQLKGMSLEQLGNIEVTTVSKQPEEVWHTPAAIFVLTHEDIVRSGATTIPDLLRLVPGVQVSQEQSDQWAVGIRGFASPFSKGLLVLIDGRSVYTPLDEGVYWDVQDLVFDDIDRIEVVRGPGGTIWGPNAVNGVINIITRSADETRGAKVQADGGDSVERFTGSVRQGLRMRPDLDVRVFAKGFNRGPELNPGGNPYDDWHQERGGFRLDWRPTGRDRLDLSGVVYGGASGEEITVSPLVPPSNLSVDGNQLVAGGDVRLRWERHLGGGSDFYVQGYWDRTDRDTPSFTETRNTFDVDVIDDVKALPRQDIILGAGLRESPSHFVQKYATFSIAPPLQNDWIYSLFTQDAIDLVPGRVTMTLGSKFEDNNFSGWGAEPSARLLWNPRGDMTLWGSVSRALRTPGRLDRNVDTMQLVRVAPPIFEALKGNPYFRPEVLIGWEAGYRQLMRRSLYMDVAAFHNNYDDLESYNAGGPTLSHPTTPYPYSVYTFQFANGLKGVTDGVEIAPDWRPTDWLELRGNYSHLHMDLHSKAGFRQGSYAASEMGFAPHREVSVAATIALPHGVDVAPDYRYVSALPANQIPEYQTADINITCRLGKHYALAVTGRNLLQPSHREGVGDDGNDVGIRRMIYAGLEWSR